MLELDIWNSIIWDNEGLQALYKTKVLEETQQLVLMFLFQENQSV